MEFKLNRVKTISNRTDEMVRFPMFGTLNADYVIDDQDEDAAGKARVDNGVITVFALRSDLVGLDLDKIRDMLLRSIVVDADNTNANLSIALTGQDYSKMLLKRFFERFGFRMTMDPIMKRLAGSIQPPIMAEQAEAMYTWLSTGLGRAIVESMESDYSFLNDHHVALDALHQKVQESAEAYVRVKLRVLERLVPGQKFKVIDGMGALFVEMSPGFMDTPGGDNIGLDDVEDGRIEHQYQWRVEEGIALNPNLLKISPIIAEILNFYIHVDEKLHLQIGDLDAS